MYFNLTRPAAYQPRRGLRGNSPALTCFKFRFLYRPLPAEKIAAIKALAASGRGPAEVCKALDVGRSTFYKHAYEPNETTAQTLRDSQAGRDVYHAKDAADLFAQLGIEEPSGKAVLARDIQEGIFAGYDSTEDAAKRLDIPLTKLSDLLRGEFRTVSEADMHDYINRLHHPPVAPAKVKRRRATGDKIEVGQVAGVTTAQTSEKKKAL